MSTNDLLVWILGGVAVVFSSLFARKKIRSLKNQNKALKEQNENEKLARESKNKEYKNISEINKKTDEEIWNNWNNNNNTGNN